MPRELCNLNFFGLILSVLKLISFSQIYFDVILDDLKTFMVCFNYLHGDVGFILALLVLIFVSFIVKFL